MKFTQFALAVVSIVSVEAFAPSFVAKSSSVSLNAKHVNDKAARWANSKRPKKSRPSDIKRTRKVYEFESMPKPPEITEVEGN